MGQFIGRHSRFSFLFSLFLVGLLMALIGSRAQAKMDPQGVVEVNNPHRIPNEFNPRLHRAEDEIITIKQELNEEVVEATESIHELAFKNQHLAAQSTYDYTTGTSN
jgi:hypothetical protein